MSTDVAALVSDNLELWTGAIERKSGAGRGGKKVSLYGIDRLRALILDLAVRGKLVPQEAGDRPATMLLNDLLDADGLDRRKIKSHQSQHSAVAKADVPYEIPYGWAWARFDQIAKIRAELVQSLDYPDALQIAPDIIEKGTGKLLSVRTVGEAGVRGPNSRFYAGQIIYSKIRPSLSKAVIAEFDGLCSADMYPLESRINPRFLLKTILSEPFLKQVRIAENRIKMPKLNKESLGSFIVAIPPLAEQHRIVAKIDELMALCDALEAQSASALEAHQTLVETLLATLVNATDVAAPAGRWERLEAHFDTIFTTEASIDALKHTVLQLAVRGRLVRQDKCDEPANELLKKTAKRKLELIRSGLAKRDKVLGGIEGASTPFQLPQGWTWARFPEIGIFERGKSKHRPRNDPKLFQPGIYPLVQTGEVARATGLIDEYHSQYSELGLAQSKLWPKGTLCITIAANIADAAILGFDACFPDSVVGFIPCDPISDPRYFLYFVRTAKADLLKFAPSTAQKNINLGILETVLIPLPPKPEMDRIVAKVDELMALCDVLKARLAYAAETRKHLADAVVERAAA